jgi:DNA-binding CsgD family transcriptional regulator
MRLVGRDAERSALCALLDEARAGATRLATVEGEPGIGKTRLVDELVASRAAAAFAVYRACAEEHERDRPFRVLVKTLRIDAASPDPARRATARMLDAGGGPGADHRFRLTDAVVDIVERDAVRGPVLLVVEDVHWADAGSLFALLALCRRTSDVPLLLVATCRPVPRPPELERMLDAMVESGATSLRLAALADEAVRELATARLGADPEPSLRARLGGAGGNPLFVLELLDALERDPDTKVPRSLRSLVLRRIRFLDPESIELLRTACVLGESFSSADLSIATGKPVLDILAVLQEPVAAGFVSADGESFVFRHDVVREALYLDLPAAVRTGMHLHAGRALAAAGAPPERVARHLALGAQPGDRDAVAWLRAAAGTIVSRAPASAADLLRLAASLLPSDDADRASLEIDSLRPLYTSGRVGEADDLARDLAARVRDADEAARMCVERVSLLLVRFLAHEAEGAAGDALRNAALPEPARAQLLAMSAVARASTGDVTGALERLGALQPYTDAHPSSRPTTLALRVEAAIAWGRGDIARAVDLMERSVAASSGSYGRLGESLLYLGSSFVGLDRFDDAARTLGDARTRLERVGSVALLQEHHWIVASLHFARGRWDDALAEVATSRRLSRETGVVGMRLVRPDASPLVHLYRGDVDAARGSLAAIDDDPTAGASTLPSTWIEPMRALVQDSSGDAAGAIETVRRCRAASHAMTFLPDYRGLARGIVGLCARDREMLAQIVTDAVDARARAGGVASVEGTAFLVEGMARGDEELLLAAVEAFRASSRPFELAEACAEAGLQLLDSGDDARGRALVDEAFAAYDAVGARRAELALARDVRRFGIGRGARGRRRRPATGWDALTDTEQRVVALVAGGLTNGEVAGRLFISSPTVATHLRSVFRKLGVASRTELAAVAAGRKYRQA